MKKSRFDVVLRAISGLVPAALAAAGAATVASAAHDDGVVRTVGAGYSGVLRALDLLVAAPALLLPIGTRSLRAGLASAVIAGICGALAFDLARAIARAVPSALRALRLVRGVGPDEVSPRLESGVAAVAVLMATASPAWQAEAAAPGGAVTGALLILLALHVVTRDGREDERMVPTLALLTGLAASYEPLLVLALAAGAAPLLRARGVRLRAVVKDRAIVLRSAAALALGLVPLGLGLAVRERAPEIALSVPAFALVDTLSAPIAWRAFLVTDIGVALAVVAALGTAAAFTVPSARPLALSLALLVAVAAIGVVLRGSAGPSRYAAAVLVGLLAVHVLAVTTLAALVVAIARTRVPFAEASAALIVVLELVLPVRAIDETLSRREGQSRHAAAVWNDVAWGAAPPAAVLLVAARSTMARIASARAAGAMRGDLLVVPAYDVQGRAGQRALAAEPKLAPLYRDVVLGLPPEELALAQLGGQRPLLASFDPRWDRPLSRHLVPVGLTSRFEPEPRGASDRKKALEAFLSLRDRLVRAVVAKKDPDLAAATATLLKPRAIAMAATGERDMLDRALDDLRNFAPHDPLETVLVRRIVTSKGPIEVRDLVP